MDAPLLRSELEQLHDGTAILHLAGEIDMSNAEEIVDHFQTAADGGLTRIVIDATGITFIDSSGLHAFIRGKRLMHESGAKIALVPSRQMNRLLEVTFPEPLFALRVESVEEALEQLEVSGS